MPSFKDGVEERIENPEYALLKGHCHAIWQLYEKLQPWTKPVETHYKNTYFFALTLTKILTVAN